MNFIPKRSLNLFTALLVLFTLLSFPSLTKAAEVSVPGKIIPNVVVVGVGGTITSTSPSRELFQTYGTPKVPIKDIIQRLQPELSKVANVTSTELSNISSAQTTSKDLYNLTIAVDKELSNPAVDAVVVTTGTNIMEELAYWTDLTVRSPKPVVFTGSMRQSNTISFDGEANLLNAIRLAASKKTAYYGTVLMMNDEFFAAREVTKTDALRLDTFDGGRYGALGTVDENRIRAVRAPARVKDAGTEKWKTPFDLSTIQPEDLAKVDVVYSYTEASATPITALADEGVKGIVTAGHGAGGISTAQQAARTAAIEKGVLFVNATRAGSGAVYDTGAKGIIGAGDLLPQKARILLQLGLTFSKDQEQIRQWFSTIGMPDFDMSK
ncbi:asparaginase [Paenibacillus tritici]|jgi:L-asparaginase|uniref:Asparaginase n=1 Tax=Paenibacillus tritici TaxID=1873425 RepID=A0ABX2DX80_9BACL|nr:asparaginase [Paenibacillus tritici]NQX49317.1 asparaginase [Paenibacillus tritici]QUL56812.1 asparaginase [Paenibacillus tritici]